MFYLLNVVEKKKFSPTITVVMVIYKCIHTRVKEECSFKI